MSTEATETPNELELMRAGFEAHHAKHFASYDDPFRRSSVATVFYFYSSVAEAWRDWQTAYRAGAARQAARGEADSERRYSWLRGDVPQHSTRWPRWRIEHWRNGQWEPLHGVMLDSAIDAAKSGDGNG